MAGNSSNISKPSYFYSIVSITLVLFIIGLLGITLIQIRLLSAHLKENIEITLIVSDKAIQSDIDKMKSDGSWDTLNKREKLFKSRQRDKLEKTFGSIADMTRQPAAIFIVDILKEHIALAEARRLNIPTFAIVDTNSNPKMVDFPIPANDDATKSIALILDVICQAIQDGLEDRKNLKNDSSEDSEEQDVAVAAVETAPVAAEPVKETVEEPVAEAPATEAEPVAEVAEEASEETTEEASEEPAEEGSSTEA